MEIFDRQFLSDFLSNFIATLIGAFLGFGGGVWLERRAEVKARRAKVIEERKRVIRVLELLKEELIQDKSLLSQIHKDVASYYTPPKDELWSAFSDGGELQWINDPELLSIVSESYYHIRKVGFLYGKYFDVRFFGQKWGTQDLLLQSIIKFRDEADSKIDSALEAISSKLKSIT